MDPRLQARRQEIARREGARRLWLIGGLTIVTSLAIAVIAALNSSWFDIERVDVVGAGNADPVQIVAASGLVVGEPLVELDTGLAAAAVTEVPWVADARVRRNWRGVVTIEVTERSALAAVAVPAGQVLVDRSGRQLEVVATAPDGLLTISGLEVSAEPGDTVPPEGLVALSLLEGLSPAVAPLVTGVVLDGTDVQVALTVGGRANFGDDRDLETKMVALETILARVDLSCLAMIDLRAPLAPTVRRSSPATPDGDDPSTTTGSAPAAGVGAAPGAGGEEPLADPGGC